MCAAGLLQAQTATVTLPSVDVYSPRVANQAPVGTFAMPVSALRFEPLVDAQTRNLAEAQADVTLRGGIFENTGFRVGAVSLSDPQTGHYFADIPIAPAMLGAPEILTGTAHALGSFNSTVGAVSYDWRPIRTAGSATVAAGEYGMNREEVYAGRASDVRLFGRQVRGDVDWAHSASDGSIKNGDSHFDRVNGRVQLADKDSQTDLFAGYQAKFFGWPNLYTPFNSNESENLETVLIAANHRVNFGPGNFLEIGAYHRRNKDDYAYDRFAPLGPVHPYQHTTWLSGAAADGRYDFGAWALNARGEFSTDELRSTSLTAGRYHTRTMEKIAVLPETSIALDDGGKVVLKAGATYDDSNRDSGAVSPVVEVAREGRTPADPRVYISYATSTQLPSYTALNSSATAGLFRGNPNLGREKSHNLEAGVSGFLDGWTGQAAVFYRQDDSLVDWTFRQGVTARTASAVDIDTTGLEFVASYPWTNGELVFGYTYLTKDADYRGAIVDASFYALNYARHRLTLAATMRLTPTLQLRLDNEARWQIANVLRTQGGDHAFLTSISLAWRPAALRNVELAAAVDNAWNDPFQEVPAVPAARRQASFSATYFW